MKIKKKGKGKHGDRPKVICLPFSFKGLIRALVKAQKKLNK